MGLDSLQGLQAARILAARGVPVIGVAADPQHYCCRTRVCERIVIAQTKDVALIDTLAQIGASLTRRAVLIPCQDAGVLLIARHRDWLAAYFHIGLAAYETLELLMDKSRFYEWADAQGLPIPATRVLRTREDAVAAAASLSFPCVLKPHWRTAEWELNSMTKAFRVADAGELMAAYDRCSEWVPTLLAQEWIAGGDDDLYTCNAYLDADGRVLASLVSRKLRQWPPRTGEGCSAVECRNERVLEATLDLFGRLPYRGLAYLEVKHDRARDGYFIIEPNVGRPTGRSALAEVAGVELLWTMYCDLLGRALPEQREQAFRGAVWVHLRRDFQAGLAAWRQGDLGIREWWKSRRGPRAYALFSWRDPGPFLADLWRALRILLSPSRRRRRYDGLQR